MAETAPSHISSHELVDAFRNHYRHFEAKIQEAVQNSADTTLLWKLGEDLSQYIRLVHQVSFHMYVLYVYVIVYIYTSTTSFLILQNTSLLSIIWRSCRMMFGSSTSSH